MTQQTGEHKARSHD